MNGKIFFDEDEILDKITPLHKPSRRDKEHAPPAEMKRRIASRRERKKKNNHIALRLNQR